VTDPPSAASRHVGTPPDGRLEQAVARIRSANGAVAGTAFQVGARTVLTCAHVVDRARVTDGESVTVEFPLLPGSTPVAARITVWVPVRDDDSGDIAVLTLGSDPPPDAMPAPMVTEADLWGHPCRIFGFSTGRDHGVWVSGVLRGRQAAGWIQLESSGIAGYAVEPGFSGAPVWDDNLGAVVGMAVAAETDGDLRAAYMIPTALLAQAWPDLDTVLRPPCPYRGLAAFREQDAAAYFGRKDLTGQLIQEIGRRTFVAVVGPSGVGKSSLVFGGLLPLVHVNPEWVTATMRAAQASSGVAALAAALLPLLEPDQAETERLAAMSRLTTVLRDGHLRDVVARCLARARADRLLLVIDQFEEVFGSPDAPELIEVLLTGRDPAGLTIVITLRADFLGPALHLPALAEALRESVTAVGRMDRRRLRQVIELPLPKDVAYEPGLVDRILDDVGDEPGGLPLLEFALTLLWDRQEHGRLTHAAYQELGGVKGALAQYAEQVYRDRVASEDRKDCRRLLVQLVRPTETGESVRRVARRAELGEKLWSLGQRLAETRLVVADRDAVGSETLELVHETLLDGWTRLRDWSAQDLAFRAWQERMRREAAEWESLGRDAGVLLRGMPLAEALRWLGERQGDISDAERQYIRASSLHQGRSVRRLRVIVGALAVLVLAAAGLGVLSVRRGHETERQARESESRYLVGQAQTLGGNLNSGGRDLALLLSAAAYHFSDDDQAVANLTTVASRWPYVSHLLATENTGSPAFSTIQPNILAIPENNRIALWDVLRRERIKSIPSEGAPDSGVAFSRGGDFLIFAEGRSQGGYRVRRWRLADDKAVTVWENKSSEASVDGIQTSRDGKRVAICTDDAYEMWSVSPPSRLSLAARSGDSNDCAFAWSSNGTRLFFADGQDIVTWNVSLGRPVSRAHVPLPALRQSQDFVQRQRITGLSVAPDARTAVVTGTEGFVWWDLARGARLTGYSSEPAQNAPPSFSADGRWVFFPNGALVRADTRRLTKIIPSTADSTSKTPQVNSDGSIAAVDSEGIVEITKLNDFDLLPLPDAGEMALWPDGQHLTAVSNDGTAAAWNLRPPGRFSVEAVKGVPGPAGLGSVLSVDGGHYAQVDSQQRIHLADLTSPQPVTHVLARHWNVVRALALDPDGVLVAAADQSTVHVVNASDGAVMASVPLPSGYSPDSIAIGPGGRYLVVTDSNTGGSVIWDLSGPRPKVISPLGALQYAVLSADGRLVGAVAGDTVVAWDLGRRAEVRRFAGTSVQALDPQGRLIALNVRGSNDNENLIEVRDVRDGHLVSTVSTLSTESVTFTADGGRLATTDGGVLTEYPLNRAWALDRVCHLAGRELSKAEWKNYAAGFPYEKVCS
jgi:WD40 repeat protein